MIKKANPFPKQSKLLIESASMQTELNSSIMADFNSFQGIELDTDLCGNFELLKFRGKDLLTIKVLTVSNLSKSYLSQQSQQQFYCGIGSGTWPLKVGWENARFAVITLSDTDEILGVIAEYNDDTFSMLNRYASKIKKTEIKRLNTLISSYLYEEAKTLFHREHWGWEEITPGAVIREQFTSRENITGLWAKEVAVIDPGNCNVCQQCGIWCPEDAIQFNPVTGKIDLIDYDYCKGCGMCDFVCPSEQNVIEMVEESQVKAAQTNVFHGIYARRIEAHGDYAKSEVDGILNLPVDEYQLVYRETSGKKSLSGHQLNQVLYTLKDLSERQRPILYTYVSKNGKQWKKIIRPLTNILVYGMSDYDKELAARMQSEGFRITAISSTRNGEYNKALPSFEKANVAINSNTSLEELIESTEPAIDAVVSAHFDNITVTQDKLIMEKIGVFRAPFMPSHARDNYLEDIINDVQAKRCPNRSSKKMIDPLRN